MAEKIKQGRKTFRGPQELFDELQAIADVDKRSLNNLVVEIILAKYRDRMRIDPKYTDALKKLKEAKK